MIKKDKCLRRSTFSFHFAHIEIDISIEFTSPRKMILVNIFYIFRSSPVKRKQTFTCKRKTISKSIEKLAPRYNNSDSFLPTYVLAAWKCQT